MRVLFALPGLHRQNRGAEAAFIAVARELNKLGDTITLIGSGAPQPDSPYHFIHAASVRRERFESFPFLPLLRNEYTYEELTFVPNLLRRYRPQDYDVTLTCSYPFTNWALRRPVIGGIRPPHVFVTQNGDWPATARNSEYRFFGCEGLVCINPEFYERNRERWRCRLIPNGIDCDRFKLGPPERDAFGLPSDRFVVLMVSALTEGKNVSRGIEAVSLVPEAHLIVAGDGPLRHSIDAAATQYLPDRFTRLTVSPARMPALYRSADVFLHLAGDEPFGNVFLEAMACGLPIVALDTPRLRWIIGNDEFLLGGQSAETIAAGLETARKSSPTLRHERQRKAAEFSWEKIAAMYRDFLQEIVRVSIRGR